MAGSGGGSVPGPRLGELGGHPGGGGPAAPAETRLPPRSGSRLAAARSVCILRTRRILRGTCHSYNYVSSRPPARPGPPAPLTPAVGVASGVAQAPDPRLLTERTNE